MRILLLNQAFYPDSEPSAKYAADLAWALADAGHEVTVIASRRAYVDPDTLFPAREKRNGVEIRRIRCFGFGKGAAWRRALDFGSFLLSCAVELLRLRKQDVVLTMTSPPLISCLGALFSRVKGGEMVLWIMDLNPDQLIAADWLRESSIVARALEAVLRYSLRASKRIVVLDEFMQRRVASRGIQEDCIHVLPPWSHDRTIRYDSEGRDAFRREFGLEGKFVVMYSGNHSPCHPLDTLLECARRLTDRPEITFCFVGAGNEFLKAQRFAQLHSLASLRCIPYQPLEKLAGSLSAADLHVVVMGDRFVGIVHPCKIYNILTLGIPFLYIGPSPSHVLNLLPPGALGRWSFAAQHGDVDAVTRHILANVEFGTRRIEEQVQVASCFSQDILLSRMAKIVASSQSAAYPSRVSAWPDTNA